MSFSNKIDKKFLQIFEKKPADFNSKVEVVACYLEIDGKLLLLQRAFNKAEGGTWGIPAGKIENNETQENAAIRELFEETGISLNSHSKMRCLGSLYIRKPEVDYVYHQYKIQLDKVPVVHLSEEHQSYKWATSKDLEELPLMAGAIEVLQRYRAISGKKRTGANVNAYLILRQDDNVLLHLRKNTGYCDGMWSLVAGHVEDGESATAGMIREAYEEIGITLCSSQLKVVHVMHRQTNRLNVDVFFDCCSWKGIIKNTEPEKCERLEFFPIEALPNNIVDYNATALKAISKKEFYSEQGWE